MKTIVVISIMSIAATGVFAKSHDQGSTAVPGENVGAETVAASQTLGSKKGNRPDDKGPTNSPAIVNAGR